MAGPSYGDSHDPGPLEGTSIAEQTRPARVVCLDVFRGLVIAVMIFVNDLSSVKGLSRWTYHMPANIDAMSYVDMVFPAFLFIVGLSLPLAVQQRLKQDPSVGRLWPHMAKRSLALLILGLVLANGPEDNAARLPLGPSAWTLLALAGAVLFWMAYPATLSQALRSTLRLTGAALLMAFFLSFRSVHGGHAAWVQFEYPEILGLIGVSYFAACLLFVPFRAFRAAALLGFLLMLALNVLTAMGRLAMIHHWPWYFFPFGNGALTACVLGGAAFSSVFFGAHRLHSDRAKIVVTVMISLVCGALGYALAPLGVSKIRATPTWTLWTLSACTLLFALLYWVCDVRGWVRWAALLRPAGSNALLTYLLPDFYFFLASHFGFTLLLGRFSAGDAGVLRALGFTLAMLLLAGALTRLRVRMQL